MKITSFEVEPYHGWINRWMQRFVPVVGERFLSSLEQPVTEKKT